MSALHDVRAFVRRPWGSVLAGTVAVAVVVGVGVLAAPDPVPVVAEPVVEPVASAELLCPITVATSAPPANRPSPAHRAASSAMI